MKKILFVIYVCLCLNNAKSTIHQVYVWDGYFQFIDVNTFNPDITILLGDTVQWIPLDPPTIVHTITSTNIPSGASAFDYTWQAPADTFFQYIPEFLGLYEYECTPHVQLNMIGSINVIAPVNAVSNDILKDFKVYPNPCEQYVHIQSNNIDFHFQLMDCSGNILREGNNSQYLNVSTFPSGQYHLRIISDRIRNIKFIKK